MRKLLTSLLGLLFVFAWAQSAQAQEITFNGKKRKYVVRGENRRRLVYSDLSSTDYLGHYDYLLSAGLNGQLALGLSRYAPGGSTGDDLYAHQGEEAGIVVSGVLELTIEEEVYRLAAGDSFSFPSDLPHRYANPSDEETVVVWANTPITLRP